MAISLHDYVVERLQATKGKWKAIEDQSGVSRRTFSKIARKEVKNPRIATVQKLADYFRSKV